MKSVYPSKIAKGGNSFVIRLPRAARLIGDLGENVVLEVTPGKIVVMAQQNPRAAWHEQTKQAFAQQAETTDEQTDRQLFDSAVSDGLDENEDDYWLDLYTKGCQ